MTLVDLSADSLSEAVASLAGGRADIESRLHTYAGDVSVEGTAEGYVKETVEIWGRLDVSVQCAGISLLSADLVDLKVSDWDKTMGVNLRGGAPTTSPQNLSSRRRRNPDRDFLSHCQSSSVCSRVSRACSPPLHKVKAAPSS